MLQNILYYMIIFKKEGLYRIYSSDSKVFKNIQCTITLTMFWTHQAVDTQFKENILIN